MKHNNRLYAILGILILAYVMTKFISSHIFVANSPTINKSYIDSLLHEPAKFIASLKNKPSKQPTFANMEKLPVNALKSLATGVYAKEDSRGNVIYIRVTKDMQWEEKTIHYNGKQIKVRFPKGMAQ